LAALLTHATGVIEISGVHEIHEEQKLPDGAQNVEIRGNGAVLKLAAGFRGRAALSCHKCKNITISGLTIEGNRDTIATRQGLPSYDRTFASFTIANGILITGSTDIHVHDVKLTGIAGFAILVSRSERVEIENIRVASSGGLNSYGRNNTTGGILVEDGTSNFEVRDSTFRAIRGNGIWTHSRAEAPRNSNGSILGNHFEEIGRDAVQVGHGTAVRVANNRGRRIGFPFEMVDAESAGTPVAIDTAGNVDHSSYVGNHFEEINGKCIDLDGFHHGSVEENVCINSGTADAYPHGHFAIVMNNTNPGMQSESIRITGNVLDGTKFGGIFLIGSNHYIAHNWMRNLNKAGCPTNHTKYGCLSFAGEPDILRTGIYFGSRAERPAPAHDNIVIDNHISGEGVACLASAPGIDLKSQQLAFNQCKP
jgi:hypothetical protein